jgi:hypothetical protein
MERDWIQYITSAMEVMINDLLLRGNLPAWSIAQIFTTNIDAANSNKFIDAANSNKFIDAA